MCTPSERVEKNKKIISFLKKVNFKNEMCVEDFGNDKFGISVKGRKIFQGNYLGSISAFSDVYIFNISQRIGLDIVAKVMPIDIATSGASQFEIATFNRELKFTKLFSKMAEKNINPHFVVYFGTGECRNDLSIRNNRLKLNANKTKILKNVANGVRKNMKEWGDALNENLFKDGVADTILDLMRISLENLEKYENYFSSEFLMIDHLKIVFIERVSGSIHNLLSNTLLNRDYYQILLFQVITSIYLMHSKDTIHMDMHLGNILYCGNGGITKIMYDEYTNQKSGKKYYLPKIGYSAIIADFGLSINSKENIKDLTNQHKEIIKFRFVDMCNVDKSVIAKLIETDNANFKKYMILYDYKLFFSGFISEVKFVVNYYNNTLANYLNKKTSKEYHNFVQLRNELTDFLYELSNINDEITKDICDGLHAKKIGTPKIKETQILEYFTRKFEKNNENNISHDKIDGKYKF